VGGPSSLQVPVSNSALQSVPLRVGDVSVTTIAGSNGLVNIVQIGPGNSFKLDPSNLASGVMNVIQNTLDNQAIRQTTGIQVSANSLSLMRANTFAAAFQRQLLQSIR
jgi:hypothetical protein